MHGPSEMFPSIQELLLSHTGHNVFIHPLAGFALSIAAERWLELLHADMRFTTSQGSHTHRQTAMRAYTCIYGKFRNKSISREPQEKLQKHGRACRLPTEQIQTQNLVVVFESVLLLKHGHELKSVSHSDIRLVSNTTGAKMLVPVNELVAKSLFYRHFVLCVI